MFLLTKFTLFLFFIIHSLNSFDDLNLSLDQIAIFYDSLKGIKGHDYFRIYENYFKNLRTNKLKMLEIGFLKGESGCIWERYFPNAEIHFIDINEKAFKKYSNKLSNRCKLHVVDQGKREDLLKFIKKINDEKFDIIIDDGGHTMNQQITSFEILFPYLKENGFYIIEDLHTSYWSKYEGSGIIAKTLNESKTTIKFLQHLIDDVNFIGAKTGCADKKKCTKDFLKNLTYYQNTILSLHFYDSLCIILKR